jgi:hypothetical protein
VTEDIETLLNTAIAQMMIFVNAFTNAEKIPLVAIRTFLISSIRLHHTSVRALADIELKISRHRTRSHTIPAFP